MPERFGKFVKDLEQSEEKLKEYTTILKDYCLSNGNYLLQAINLFFVFILKLDKIYYILF